MGEGEAPPSGYSESDSSDSENINSDSVLSTGINLVGH